MNFYDRYEQVCKTLNLEPCSQATADLFGSTKSTISAWKNKNTYPKGEMVAAIADALHVSADYLLCRTDDPTDYANPDLAAELAGPVLDEFDGDIKRAVAFQDAVARDVANEKALNGISLLFARLDEIDRAKAEAYIQGLLAADKYSSAAIRKNA